MKGEERKEKEIESEKVDARIDEINGMRRKRRKKRTKKQKKNNRKNAEKKRAEKIRA